MVIKSAVTWSPVTFWTALISVKGSPVWYELASINGLFSILVPVNDSDAALLSKIWLFASDVILVSNPCMFFKFAFIFSTGILVVKLSAFTFCIFSESPTPDSLKTSKEGPVWALNPSIPVLIIGSEFPTAFISKFVWKVFVFKKSSDEFTPTKSCWLSPISFILVVVANLLKLVPCVPIILVAWRISTGELFVPAKFIDVVKSPINGSLFEVWAKSPPDILFWLSIPNSFVTVWYLWYAPYSSFVFGIASTEGVK